MRSRVSPLPPAAPSFSSFSCPFLSSQGSLTGGAVGQELGRGLGSILGLEDASCSSSSHPHSLMSLTPNGTTLLWDHGTCCPLSLPQRLSQSPSSFPGFFFPLHLHAGDYSPPADLFPIGFSTPRGLQPHKVILTHFPPPRSTHNFFLLSSASFKRGAGEQHEDDEAY